MIGIFLYLKWEIQGLAKLAIKSSGKLTNRNLIKLTQTPAPCLCPAEERVNYLLMKMSSGASVIFKTQYPTVKMKLL